MGKDGVSPNLKTDEMTADGGVREQAIAKIARIFLAIKDISKNYTNYRFHVSSPSLARIALVARPTGLPLPPTIKTTIHR
jgi:hypothetical protein